MGRPAAVQPQVSRRERRVRVPAVDSRCDRIEPSLRQAGARAADRARQLVRQSGGQLLPRDRRRQAGDGEDDPGVPGRADGVRAVPRSSVRALDAGSACSPDVGVLRRGRPARRLRSRGGDRLRSACRLRPEESQGRARHEAAVHGRVRRRADSRRRRPPRRARRLAHVEGQPVLRQGDGEPDVELFHGPGHHRAGGRHPCLEPAVESRPARRADEGLRRRTTSICAI